MVFFLLGMPVAFAFLLANIIGLVIFTGGTTGLTLIVSSAFDSLRRFTYWPIPLFIMMGEVFFRSGAISRGLAATSEWTGRVPGRLGIVSIANGAVFGALSGSTLASTALLSSLLVPEMRKYGYSNLMIAGPIMAGGNLALIIPPSIFVIVIGSLADESIAQLLIAALIPGLVLALFYMFYVILTAWWKPNLAPLYVSAKMSLLKRFSDTVHVLPLVGIIFLVTGFIFLGVCTPTEAAALGTIGAFFLAAGYRKLNLSVVRDSAVSSTKTSAMIFMIIVGSSSFSELMAATGATKGLVSIVTDLALPAIAIVVIMQLMVLMLGCFIEPISIMMIAIPIFMPVVRVLGIDPIWFLTILLITLTLGGLTPPFGLTLFVYKGCDPRITMEELYRSAIPIVLVTLVVVAIMFVFPFLATWLPSLMGK